MRTIGDYLTEDLFEIKTEQVQHKGAVTRKISKRGYGFVRTDQGQDYFFHFSNLKGIDFKDLREGDQVSFNLRDYGDQAGPCAVNIIKNDKEQK